MEKPSPTERVGSVVRGLIKAGGFMAAYLCLPMMLVLMSLDPFLRYIVGSPFFWSNEVTTLLMVVMFFAALGITLAAAKHVRVTLVFDMLPRKLKNILWLMICVAGLCYASILVYGAARLTFDSFALGVRTTTSEMRIFPFQSVALFGLIGFLAALLLFTADRIAIARGTKKEKEEATELIDLSF